MKMGYVRTYQNTYNQEIETKLTERVSFYLVFESEIFLI